MALGAGPASRRQKEGLAARSRGQGQTRHEALPQQATPPHAGPFSDPPRCLEWAYACVSLHSFFYFTCHVRSCSIFRVGLTPRSGGRWLLGSQPAFPQCSCAPPG